MAEVTRAEPARAEEPARAGLDVVADAYAAFNARDIERALSLMHADVEWPNGMEGGHVHGRAAVRAYWTRQWGLIDPRVDPQAMAVDAAGRVVVDVHQVVRDLAGRVQADRMVRHVHEVADGLLRRMVIGDADAPAPSPGGSA